MWWSFLCAILQACPGPEVGSDTGVKLNTWTSLFTVLFPTGGVKGAQSFPQEPPSQSYPNHPLCTDPQHPQLGQASGKKDRLLPQSAEVEVGSGADQIGTFQKGSLKGMGKTG